MKQRKDERMQIYLHNLTNETPFCINCKHFYRHYQDNLKPMNCGHCCYPRLKMRECYGTCEQFTNKHQGGKQS